MSQETIRRYPRKFCRCVVQMYSDKYLNKRPNMAELENIEKYYSSNGFVECLDEAYCSKIKCKNCPLSQKGQYHNKKEGSKATIQVEAWCDYGLYVWNWFPGRAGTNNEDTMFSFSPLFNNVLSGKFKFRSASESRLLSSVSMRELLYF